VDTGALAGSAEPTSAGEVPPLAEYDSIPLPTSPPPPGAIVAITSFADPAASGQHIAFQYQGLTIHACWREMSVSAPDACLPQSSMSLFRTVKSDDAETLFTVSTKNEADLPAEAASTVQFFKTADLAARPAWLPDYVARELAKLVGE